MNRPLAPWLAALLLALVGGLLLPAPGARAESGSADFTIDDLPAGREAVQTFIAPADGLEMIAFRVGTHGRMNRCLLRARLIDATTDRVLADRAWPCGSLEDGGEVALVFPAIADSGGRRFRLLLTSPDGVPGQAVTVWARSIASLDGGALRVGGRPVAGELITRMYTASYGAQWRRLLGTAAVLVGGASAVGLLVWAARRRLGPRTAGAALAALLASGRRRWWWLAARGAVVAAHVLAPPYGRFADEYDNLLGGRLILQGLWPHAGFFTHHLPAPYLLAAALTAVGGRDPWTLRLLLGLLLALWSIGNAHLIAGRVGHAGGLIYLALVATTVPVFWGNMLVAETLIAPALVTACLLLLGAWRGDRPPRLPAVAAWSLALATIALSSVAYAPLALALLLLGALAWARQPAAGRRRGRLAAAAAIVAAPYALAVAWLVATGTLAAFLFDTITFNAVFYAPFKPEMRGGPLTILPTIAANAAAGAGQVLTLAEGAREPAAIFGLLALVGGVVAAVCSGRAVLVALAAPLVLLAQPRGGLGDGWASNVHIAPFIHLTILAAALALPVLTRLARGWAAGWWRALAPGLAALLLGICALAVAGAGLSVAADLTRRSLTREPVALIAWEPPAVARVVNDLAGPGETVWVGPFDLEAWLFARSPAASYYRYILPWIGRCAECERRFLRDLEANRPKLVVWDPRTFVGGHNIDDDAGEVLAYLNRHSFQVERSRGGRLTRFFFPAERRDAIMAELGAKGYLP